MHTISWWGHVELHSKLSTLIETWMDEVPSACRKQFSYKGKITSRLQPETSFDPGNWTYYLGMKLLFPKVIERRTWNPHTCGDIFEAFLGMWSSTVPVNSDGQKFARWIDHLFYYLYRFCILVQDRCWTIRSFADCQQIADSYSP